MVEKLIFQHAKIVFQQAEVFPQVHFHPSCQQLCKNLYILKVHSSSLCI